MRALILAAAVVLMFPARGLGQQTDPAPERPPRPDYVRLYEGGRLAHPELLGTWEIAGYGKLLDIGSRRARLFARTAAGCWDVSELLDGVDPWIARTDREDVLRFSFHPLEGPYLLERSDELPHDCTRDVEWTPTRVFDVFAALMNELYPFFETRGFDWAAAESAARERLHDGLDDGALFELLVDTLDGLGDDHMDLSAVIEGQQRQLPGSTPRAVQRLAEALDAAGGDELDAHEHRRQVEMLTGSLFQTVRRNILERLLRGEGAIAGGQYHWGRMHDDVGYIAIMGMGSGDDAPLEDLIAQVHVDFDHMLRELRGVRAMVLDISMNGGGSDPFGQAMLAHFIDERTLLYTKHPGGRPDATEQLWADPWPGERFSGPVYVVSSDLTASAAETFQLGMRTQPQVTLVGAPARAIFSDVVPKPLPNGWFFGLSVEVYRDPDGVCHEAVGVPLDVEIPIFEGDDLRTSHAEALEAVRDLALTALDG